MSMPIVHHVREKSQAKGSARTLLLNLAIYANDCCGVAWPADATLYHDVNVSRQRIHELKNTLEQTGELVILERPGLTNLYFVAWQGTPLGGSSRDTGQHDSRCPLRHPHLVASGAALEGDHRLTHDVGEGSEMSDPREDYAPDTHGGGQIRLTPRGQRSLTGGSDISDPENKGKPVSKHRHAGDGDRSETIPPTGQCSPQSRTAQSLLVSGLWDGHSYVSAPGGLPIGRGKAKPADLTWEV
jgi:hypothetical protein